ncbi:MAG TPA: hypothetical protein VNN22_11060 [Verrucomicrobiae bacterium]|nr:hypothetical protein [Verrucomicrobiae bacterium]
MKTTLSKVRRSGVYYLMIPLVRVNEARSAQLDTWGTAVVVALLIGIVGLMRVILTA